MSLKQEGKKFCLTKYVDFGVAGEQAIQELLDEQTFSKERIFRGFEKRPIVLLERCNILPLLNNDRAVYKQKLDPHAKCNDIEQINVHLQKFALQCSVILVREDLEKLKEDFLTKNHNEKRKNKCKVANKSFNGNMRRQVDQADKSFKDENRDPQPRKRVSFSDRIIVHFVTDYHSCRKCKKIFKDYKRLKLHIRRRHEKRKRYICNYCAKEFLDRVMFTSHIKLHCDMCGVLTQSKVQYLEHRRNVCRCNKKYNCKTCGDSYFKLMDLKEHNYGHIGTFFVCDICKDQFESKCSLVHHISFLHSKKPPNELYTYCKIGNKWCYHCKFCNQSSFEKDKILSHTALLPDLKNQATTNYEDYYFCNQCLKRFDKETNMLQHKQSHRKVETIGSSPLKQERPIVQQTEEQNGIKANNKKTEHTKEELSTNKKGEDDNVSRENLCVSTNSKSVQGKLYSLLKQCNNGNKNDSNKNTVNVININLESIDYSNPPKKAIVDPKSKKTIISRHNCEHCGKYYSSNYTLSRHKKLMHGVEKSLQCHVCEETFVWPSLLESHRCIRRNIPEMPFQDARPEILFDNFGGSFGNADLLNDEDDDMVGVDFDIPAPIVELTEYNDQFIITDPNQQYNNMSNLAMCVMPFPASNYNLVVQEVPIEF